MVKSYGGQAVIEGVMMKSDEKLATAVRLPNGKIKVKKENLRKKRKWLTYPFIRGVANLVEILVIGIRTLLWSADQQLDKHEKITTKEIVFTLITTILFAILIFVGLPYILTVLAGIKEETRPILFNLVDGVIKLSIFIGYLLLISLMNDVKRVFQYHGAEHKTIYCHEAKKPLNLANVKKYSTLHPRCGTSFLVIVMGISVLVFSVLPSIVMLAYPSFLNLGFILQKIVLFSSRIVMIPVIAGISYELLKISAKYDNWFMRMFTFPGLLIQRITTKEPDDKQLEVAIKALKEII